MFLDSIIGQVDQGIVVGVHSEVLATCSDVSFLVDI